MDAADRLFVQFQRPRQRQEHHLVAAVLEVQAVAGRLGVDGQQLDLAVVPPLDHVGAVVQRPQVRVAGLQLRQLLDEVIDEDRIVLLVPLKDFVQHVEAVRREPVRILVGFENACLVRGF